ncbi:hypothetical protein FOXG_17193 [Fusarium oxysporum f. sp. lycopersici 4287]|uniref:Uncharacterized protein n=2 Tax=Fusarium oxysporum TaxID=5507 RepID=A0A0J9WCD5_FUSO4|nr:uncharacterized protein FOXG_17193 [Fusarium oxysporum f. sp. lycopersici 4287]KNB20221.1 hypothetical protein FOXG_17193 [Fusarium oxysporum f. sp. lycopersici 4287]
MPTERARCNGAIDEIRRRRRLHRKKERELADTGGERQPREFCAMWEEKIVEEGQAQGLDEEHQNMWRRIRENELRERKPALWRLLIGGMRRITGWRKQEKRQS